VDPIRMEKGRVSPKIELFLANEEICSKYKREFPTFSIALPRAPPNVDVG
jgi:hypothetical protein